MVMRALICWGLLVVLAGSPAEAAGIEITHGPILGRLGADQIGVWVRTSKPGTFRVRYGKSPDRLDLVSQPADTRLAKDNTGWVLITGLEPNTRYFYRATVGESGTGGAPDGSFRTLPAADDVRHPKRNPRGLFNFSFEFGCGNHQSERTRQIAVFDTLLKNHLDDVNFTIQNGDWIYEEDRDYTLDEWCSQVGIAERDIPRLVRTVPSIVGVWENYKSYLARCESLARLHRNLPAFFTYDDHEIIDDSAGAGSVGARPRRGVFRDIAVQAWYDYVGWSNPVHSRQPIHFGTARLEAGSSILTDPDADFAKLDLDQAAELHVHWGGPTAGLLGKQYDTYGGDPNAGVYRIVRVVDPHRLEIHPAARHDGQASYSIGRLSYFKMRLANCDIVFLDTRGHRHLPDNDNPKRKGLSILGQRQKAWLKHTMAASDADCFFVVSSVNFMIPHLADVSTATEQEDSWTGYVQERDEMIDFFQGLGKKVFLLTGDLHNSFVVKVTDDVWEFASAPHNSGNARMQSEGGRPPNGVYDSYGRKCFIRWSTWFETRQTGKFYPSKVYCIVTVNNVLRYAAPENEDGWQAYPYPQVIFHYYDGFTGNLLYAESVVLD